MSNVVSIANRRTWQEWTKLINGAWQKGVVSILETGQLLIDAKGELDHGAFEPMVQLKLRFSPRTARRLMAIAAHPIISNRTHGSDLPPSWRTLYELTRLPHDTLRAKLKDGTINPDMERKDVAKLRDPKPSKPKKKPTIDAAQKTYLAAAAAIASELSNDEKRKRVFRVMEAFGLRITDFYQEMNLPRHKGGSGG